MRLTDSPRWLAAAARRQAKTMVLALVPGRTATTSAAGTAGDALDDAFS